MKCYSGIWVFCVCVTSASTVHSSLFLLPVIHLHAVIKRPNLCLGGTAVVISCRRLRPRCAPGSWLLSRAVRASLQLAATAGGAVLPGLHLPLGSLGGIGWLWRTPPQGFIMTGLIQGCVLPPVTFPAHICSCLSSRRVNKMALLGYSWVYCTAGGV